LYDSKSHAIGGTYGYAVNHFVRKNRDLWDEWAEINYRSRFYDVEGYKQQRTPLDELARENLGELAGKRVLHLQCHFGLDTLRIAGLAEEVVGVDFSPRAISLARDLAYELGSTARFVESDVYALRDTLRGEFDIVFASYGVLHWLPSLDPWGEVVAHFLAPGGALVLVDSHPTLMMFEFEPPEPRVGASYFHAPEPMIMPPSAGNYADPEARYSSSVHSWQHEMSAVVMALVRAGLRIEAMREYPFAPWQALACLVEVEPDRWTVPAGKPQLPLTFALRATKR
jgi:SAM-dependent methyltransferase